MTFAAKNFSQTEAPSRHLTIQIHTMKIDVVFGQLRWAVQPQNCFDLFFFFFTNIIENFQVNPKYAVTLKFKDWDLRSSQGCSQHFVQIFDGKFDYSPAITDKLWFGRIYIYFDINIFVNR